MAACPDRAAVSRIQGLDRVGGADHFPYLDVVVQEGDELFPCVTPQAYQRAVLSTPFLVQFFQCDGRGVRAGRCVYWLQILPERILMFPWHQAKRVADQMNVMPISA
jgi:hypothetical protein